MLGSWRQGKLLVRLGFPPTNVYQLIELMVVLQQKSYYRAQDIVHKVNAFNSAMHHTHQFRRGGGGGGGGGGN